MTLGPLIALGMLGMQGLAIFAIVYLAARLAIQHERQAELNDSTP